MYVGLCLSEERGSLGRIAVLAGVPVALTVEKAQRDERVEKVIDPSLVELGPFTKLRTGHRTHPEMCEHLQLDRG